MLPRAGERRPELGDGHELGAVDQRAGGRRHGNAVERGDVVGMQRWPPVDDDADDPGPLRVVVWIDRNAWIFSHASGRRGGSKLAPAVARAAPISDSADRSSPSRRSTITCP